MRKAFSAYAGYMRFVIDLSFRRDWLVLEKTMRLLIAEAYGLGFQSSPVLGTGFP